MNRITAFIAVMVALMGVTAAIASAAGGNSPQILAAGNASVCNLGSHKTFRLKLRSWGPDVLVRLKIIYEDGTDYPVPLANHGNVPPGSHGVIRVDSHGSFDGKKWACWPNGNCSTCKVPDKQTGYIVTATQLGLKPGQRPVVATTTFMVMK